MSYSGKNRSIILPKTGSDHRGPMNAVTALRKELRNLGAQPVERAPVSKRERDMLKRTTIAPARLTVTEKLVKILIPTDSPLYPKFVDKKGQPTSYWAFWLKSNPLPNGKPILVVEKKPNPEPGAKFAGISRGNNNEVARAFIISIQGKAIANILKHGPFGVTGIKMIEEAQDRVEFEWPDETKPIAKRFARANKGKAMPAEKQRAAAVAEPEADPAPLPSKAFVPHPREPEVPAPTLNMPPIIVQPQVNFPEGAFKQMSMIPRESVSIERAVAALNAAKNKYGDDIQFVVGSGGFLVVRAKLGGMPK